MRGSARRSSDKVAPASAPRVLAGDFIPVHPDQSALDGRTATGNSQDEASHDSGEREAHPKKVKRGLKGVEPKPKLRRTGHITVRLSAEERTWLDAAAERAGLMNGSFIRQLIFGAPMPRQVRRPPIERKELARLLGEIGKVGSNINQLAHSSNAGLPIARRELETALAELQTVREAILSALGREP